MILYNVKAEKLIKFLQSCNLQFFFKKWKKRKIVEKEFEKQEKKKEENNARKF